MMKGICLILSVTHCFTKYTASAYVPSLCEFGSSFISVCGQKKCTVEDNRDFALHFFFSLELMEQVTRVCVL